MDAYVCQSSSNCVEICCTSLNVNVIERGRERKKKERKRGRERTKEKGEKKEEGRRERKREKDLIGST